MSPVHVNINFQLTGLGFIAGAFLGARFLRLFYNLRWLIAEVEKLQAISLDP